MKTITLPARRNGNHIDPLAPFEIPDNAQLFIVVATPESEEETEEEFRADRYALSAMGLARAYSDDEPEYPDSMIKEPDPEYGKS